MKEVLTKQGKHKVKFYDNPRELPIRRYAKFNKHSMIAMQVGDSMDDYFTRCAREKSYLEAEDYKSAIIELTNRHQMVYNAFQEYQPKGMALSVIVYSIDGKVYNKYDEDTLNEIQDELDRIGFTKEQMDSTLSDVKKNSRKSWSYGIRRGLGKTLISWRQGLKNLWPF